MTVAERMLRDGWTRIMFGWMRYECGIWCWVDDGHGYGVQAPEGPVYPAVRCDHGMRSLAQRAKAAARKLARERSKR